MLAGLDITVEYLDNALLKIEIRLQHSEQQLFQRIKDYGFKLCEEKWQFFTGDIKYMGQIIVLSAHKPN